MVQIPLCFQPSVFSFQCSEKTAGSREHGTAEARVREIRLGQQGGEKRKTLRAKVLGGSQKSSGKLEKLFSSFLRGASCPKSPRVAATAALLFMPESIADVKRPAKRP